MIETVFRIAGAGYVIWVVRRATKAIRGCWRGD